YSPASRTATRRRYRAIHVAAASPAGPPPTTIASNRSPDTWDSVPEHATGETEARDGEGGDGAARSRHGGDGEPSGGSQLLRRGDRGPHDGRRGVVRLGRRSARDGGDGRRRPRVLLGRRPQGA